MGIMCSVVKETGLVTFDLGIAPNGDPLFRISWWNGERWAYAKYRTFDAAHKTYKVISRMI